MRQRVLVAAIVLALAALASCSGRSQDAGLQQEWAVYGENPVSVVEGFFAELEHGTLDETDLIDPSLHGLGDEPPTSVDRLDVFLVEADESQAVCEADFELAQVSSDAGTIERSEHTWVFQLTFYESRGSYIITGIERD